MAEDKKIDDQIDPAKNEADTQSTADEVSDAELDQVAGGKAH